MIDLNATQAAIRAGYSKKTAESTASRLLTYVKVQDKIALLKESLREETRISVKSVVDMITDTHRRAKDDDDYTAELKATDMLMKHTGGYEKNNEQIGQTITDILAVVAGNNGD